MFVCVVCLLLFVLYELLYVVVGLVVIVVEWCFFVMYEMVVFVDL